MRKQILAPLAAGVLLAFAGAAQAVSTKTATFTVNASVGKNCVISAGDINFVDPFVGDNNLTAAGDIEVRCTLGTAYSIELSAGSSGDFAGREMVRGTDVLVYNLHTDNTYGTVWGDGSGTTDIVSDVGEGMAPANAISHTVYAQLLAVNNVDPVEAGDYIDTVIATIEY
jgi:spore coat protein U-like protein